MTDPLKTNLESNQVYRELTVEEAPTKTETMEESPLNETASMACKLANEALRSGGRPSAVRVRGAASPHVNDLDASTVVLESANKMKQGPAAHAMKQVEQIGKGAKRVADELKTTKHSKPGVHIQRPPFNPAKKYIQFKRNTNSAGNEAAISKLRTDLDKYGERIIKAKVPGAADLVKTAHAEIDRLETDIAAARMRAGAQELSGQFEKAIEELEGTNELIDKEYRNEVSEGKEDARIHFKSVGFSFSSSRGPKLGPSVNRRGQQASQSPAALHENMRKLEAYVNQHSEALKNSSNPKDSDLGFKLEGQLRSMKNQLLMARGHLGYEKGAPTPKQSERMAARDAAIEDEEQRTAADDLAMLMKSSAPADAERDKPLASASRSSSSGVARRKHRHRSKHKAKASESRDKKRPSRKGEKGKEKALGASESNKGKEEDLALGGASDTVVEMGPPATKEAISDQLNSLPSASDKAWGKKQVNEATRIVLQANIGHLSSLNPDDLVAGKQQKNRFMDAIAAPTNAIGERVMKDIDDHRGNTKLRQRVIANYTKLMVQLVKNGDFNAAQAVAAKLALRDGAAANKEKKIINKFVGNGAVFNASVTTNDTAEFKKAQAKNGAVPTMAGYSNVITAAWESFGNILGQSKSNAIGKHGEELIGLPEGINSEEAILWFGLDQSAQDSINQWCQENRANYGSREEAVDAYMKAHPKTYRALCAEVDDYGKKEGYKEEATSYVEASLKGAKRDLRQELAKGLVSHYFLDLETRAERGVRMGQLRDQLAQDLGKMPQVK